MENKNFTSPKHWLGIEELEASYWENAEVQEKRGQEFFEKPIEWLEKMDKADATATGEGPSGGIARREFLTVMGASMALAATACARRPVHKIIPYVVKPEEITPGIANYYATSMSWDGETTGLLVKTREGRPIKLEGNPDHPINQGKISAKQQASLLSLYDPERLKTPLTIARDMGATPVEASWEQVDAELLKKFKIVSQGTSRVRLVTKSNPSETSQKLISDFGSYFKSFEHIEFDPAGLSDVAEGQAASYGSAVVPRYRFDQADVVVSLGADFLGSWPTSVENAKNWSKKRKIKGTSAHLSKFYVFESMMSVTGANADERYPVRSGEEYKIALAIAHEIILKRGVSSYASDGEVKSALTPYSPEAVAKDLSIAGGEKTISKIAAELLSARGKGIVIAGGVSTRSENQASLQAAVNLLNSALDNEGQTVDGTSRARVQRSSTTALSTLFSDLQAGKVDVLILHQANLAYWFQNLKESLKKVPFTIVVSDRETETSLFADYVLPESHFLESWGDSTSFSGFYNLRQPVISPLHNTRSFEENLVQWVKGLGAKSGPEYASYYDYLKASWRGNQFSRSSGFGSFDSFWEQMLKMGFFQAGGSSLSRRSFKTAALSSVPKSYPSESSGLKLALYSKVSMGDGESANNAWLQELPDPVTTITWDNYLNMSPATAQKLSIKQNDVVEVVSDEIRVELPVNVQPGLHADTVAVAIGYGRTKVGKVGNEAGINVFPFVSSKNGMFVFSGRTVSVKKTGRFYRLAATQWHNTSENRPVINDITLTEYQKNPHAHQHTNPELRMETVPTIWPQHEYKGYRWGMAIDLNSCIGCNACMIACQAENNIPVVGRDQVRVSRQMHWIKIDRYYSGSPEKPDVLFQPMLCQHCENAPCETVCPVLATVHNDEGLNIQAYNRCVGTRYCSNNCPYKARRFNFFDHWKSYQDTMNLVWNPDVTVRSRGIMEKCTFCTQRITEAKDKAKDENRKVRDGEVVPACQQTCPTDAIVFGDMNDPNSSVSLQKKEARVFRSLEVLNTRPSVNYLTKVRNKEGDSHTSSHQQGAHS